MGARESKTARTLGWLKRQATGLVVHVLYRAKLRGARKTSSQYKPASILELQNSESPEATATIAFLLPSDEERKRSLDLLKQWQGMTPEAAREAAIAYFIGVREHLDTSFGALMREDTVCAYEPSSLLQPPCYWVTPPSHSARVLLYIHGGGMVWGRFAHQGKLLGPKLAVACKARVLHVDYRLLPEASVFDAIEDCVDAYRYLVEKEKIPPTSIFIGGESSGGYLTLMTLIKARDRGLPMPAAAVTLSPDTDVTLSGDSHKKNKRDMIHIEEMQLCAHIICGFGTIDPCTISPLFLDLHGLPPLLVQAARPEVSADDAVRIAVAAAKAGVKVRLEMWERMFHVWQLFDELPEASAALEQIADWVDVHMTGKT